MENEGFKQKFDELQEKFENEVKRSEQKIESKIVEWTTKLNKQFEEKIRKLVQSTGLGFKKQKECFSEEIHNLDERIVDLTDDTENKIEEKFEEVTNEIKLHEDSDNTISL
eukprot:TRINITY_DN6391_c0_g1_i2.p2 TRINITY_DN6391_c0_g1~~TRINITY_DN6391_c0_g1_i2.p2  ORF type:complete len:111 (+),score=39.79 TRINITY_DN6391_c0_g1_i2:3-335(+)